MCNSYFKMKMYCFLTFVAATVLLACGQGHAGVNFNDFSSTAGLTLNGNAAVVGTDLRLAPAQPGRRGQRELARSGVVFERAFSQATKTRPAVPSMMTSL